MSTLKVDNILAVDGNPATPVSIPSLENRMASAWVNFNGIGSVTIGDSFNVSSVTDVGTGSYFVNFAQPLSNNSYSISAFSSLANSTLDSSSLSTTGHSILNKVNGSNTDSALMCSTVFSN